MPINLCRMTTARAGLPRASGGLSGFPATPDRAISQELS